MPLFPPLLTSPPWGFGPGSLISLLTSLARRTLGDPVAAGIKKRVRSRLPKNRIPKRCRGLPERPVKTVRFLP